jgi:PAS domain S-box-containing protein
MSAGIEQADLVIERFWRCVGDLARVLGRSDPSRDGALDRSVLPLLDELLALRGVRAEPGVERSVAAIMRELSDANTQLRYENERWQRAEQALRERELESGLIMDNIPSLVSLLSWNGVPEQINRQILEYTGKTEEELKGWGLNDLVHPEDRPHALERFRKYIPTGESFEIICRMRRFDGAYRWFHARHRALRDCEGRVVRWCVSVNDIDDRVRSEEAARESELKLRSIIDGIPGLVATLAPDGNLEAVNRQIHEYTGLPFEDLRHWVTNGTVHPEDAGHMGQTLVGSIAAGIPFDIEQRLRRHDGAYRWFSNRGIPARDAGGQILRWYVLLTDIHDRRQAEEALGRLRSELARISRNSSLGVLTASVAHEVSQPLSGIITNANTCLRMLAASPPNVEGAIETVRRTIRDGNRASEVVARLRALFQKKTGRTEAVDLNEAVAEVVALASSDLKRSHVELRMDCTDELPGLSADRVQLQQVILNLLLNASDAMAGVDDRPRVLAIRTAREGESVRLSVRDTGVGFAAEDAERLFEPFYTTKSSGMGIGLSVSRAIIERHHGRLWGESGDGQGATFSFTMPFAPRAAVTIATPRYQSAMGIGGDAAHLRAVKPRP